MNHLNPIKRNMRELQNQIIDSITKHAHPEQEIIRVSNTAFHFMFHTDLDRSHMRRLRIGNKDYTVASYPSWDISGHSTSRIGQMYSHPTMINMEYELPTMTSYEQSLLSICKNKLIRTLMGRYWVFSEQNFTITSQMNPYSKETISLTPMLACAMNDFLGDGFNCDANMGKGIPALFERVREDDCPYFDSGDSVEERRTLPFYMMRLHMAHYILKNYDSTVSRDVYRRDIQGK